jgi:hypothetical protein
MLISLPSHFKDPSSYHEGLRVVINKCELDWNGKQLLFTYSDTLLQKPIRMQLPKKMADELRPEWESRDSEKEIIKSSNFWNITPCIPLKFNRLGRKCCLLVLLAACFMSVSCMAYSSTCRWRRHVPPKRRLTFNGPRGVISHRIELFLTTAVRTSNCTNNLLICYCSWCCINRSRNSTSKLYV